MFYYFKHDFGGVFDLRQKKRINTAHTLPHGQLVFMHNRKSEFIGDD